MGLNLKKVAKGIGSAVKKVGTLAKKGGAKKVIGAVTGGPAGIALAAAGVAATALTKKKVAKSVEPLPPELGGGAIATVQTISGPVQVPLEESPMPMMEAGIGSTIGRAIGPVVGGAAIGQAIQHFTPGARMPVMSRGLTALMVANGALPVTASPTRETCFKCPKGYVKVTLPQTGMGRLAPGAYHTVCVLKSIATAAGLVKPSRRGGGISSSQIRAARHVQSVINSLTVARKPKTQLKKRGKR